MMLSYTSSYTFLFPSFLGKGSTISDLIDMNS